MFKFKDYMPLVFRHLREAFGIDPAHYMVQILRMDERLTNQNRYLFATR
jgi:hypothetical protein